MKPNRRSILKTLAALPLALLLPPVPAEAAEAVVLHKGWVLRAGDLARLGRA